MVLALDDSHGFSPHGHRNVSACWIARGTLAAPPWPWEPPRHTGQLPSSSSLARAMVCLPESSHATSMLRSCMSRDRCMSPSPHHRRDRCHVYAAPSTLPFSLPRARQKASRREQSLVVCQGQQLSSAPSASTPGPGSAEGRRVPERSQGQAQPSTLSPLVLHSLPRPPGSQGHPSSERGRWGL